MNGWQPIDTAPKDGTRIIVGHRLWWSPDFGHWREAIRNWDNDVYRGFYPQPSHWMPLPEPPR